LKSPAYFPFKKGGKMGRPKFLLQERKGQKPFLYQWTPVLARRKDMRPITEKEAERYLDPDYDTNHPEEVAVEAPEGEYVSDEDEDNAILNELSSDTVKVSPLDGKGGPLEITQDDILKEEVEKINRLRKKSTVEAYILEKYKMTLLPMKEVEEMKQQAIELLGILASTNSLYK
jgi:hypothetical protein